MRKNRLLRRVQADEGQAALPAVLMVFALVVVVGVVAYWANAAIEAAHSQTAADAAALAAALDDAPAAVAIGGRAGAEVAVSGGRGHAEVTGQFGRQRAVGAAVALRSSTSRRAGLAPSMVAAVARAEALLGFELQISSGYRSPAEQQWLWDHRDTNPYPVASPGTSLHERGLAIDVALSQVAALQRVAAGAGLCHPLPESDPVHFVACPIPD